MSIPAITLPVVEALLGNFRSATLNDLSATPNEVITLIDLFADKLRSGKDITFIDGKASIYGLSKSKAKKRGKRHAARCFPLDIYIA